MLDRDQAQGRATDVADIMRQVDCSKAKIALSTLCSILVLNLTPEKALGVRIKALADAPGDSDKAKPVLPGICLIWQFEADLLDTPVQALGDEITRQPPPPAA